MANEVVKAELLMGHRGIQIRNIDELSRLATGMVAGGIAPKGMTREAAIGVMAFGLELGLSPIQSLRDICFINGRPSAYGDAVSGMINRSGLLAMAPEVKYIGQGDGLTCTVVLHRKGLTGVFQGSFSIAMAKRAGLLGKDNWKNYPERMLYWRAYSMAARDGFSDVLKGLTTREEAMDLPPIEAHVISSQKVEEPSPVPTNTPILESPGYIEELDAEIASAEIVPNPFDNPAPLSPTLVTPPSEKAVPESKPKQATIEKIGDPSPSKYAVPPELRAEWGKIRPRLKTEHLQQIKSALGVEYLTPSLTIEQLQKAIIMGHEILGE